MKLKYFVIFILFLAPIPGSADKNIQTAINIVKTACESDEKIKISVRGNEGLSFLKKEGGSEVSLSKDQIKDVIRATNDAVKSQKNQDSRKCIQQHVPLFLNAMLELSSVNIKKEDDYFYLKDQVLPIDVPISILDGSPTITLVKVFEFNRHKVAKIVVEVPHRSPYTYEMSLKYSHRKKSGTFEYKDKEYKVSIINVDLQRQNATLSIVKYKDL